MLKLLMALVLVASSFGYPNALELVVAYIGFYSIAFYYTTFRVFIGLLSTSANTENLIEPFTTILINSTALFILYQTGQYAFMFWFALPFVVITILTFIFSYLLANGHIDIVTVEPEEDDEK